MNVLMIGSGKASTQVRGRQLAPALCARMVTVPSDTDLRWASVVVTIKRAGLEWAALVRRFNKPIVWDALDFWAQPEQNALNESESKALLWSAIVEIRPAQVIGATEAMAKEALGVYLPHHSRLGLTPAPAREHVSAVGYEGNKKYIGQWGNAVQAECKRRGWKFIVNPPNLRSCDILVAFRDGKWDGWMCREWKSGVKLVNAMAAGRPIITQPSAAAEEIGAIGTVIESSKELAGAFDYWVPQLTRAAATATTGYATRPDYSLSAIADRYRAILTRVVEKAA